jgi:hypothetical protein
MALPLAIGPVMVFVHEEDRVFYGWFRQNSLLRLTEGSEAEVTLDGIPGVIFKGEVTQILPVIVEGQLKPGSDLVGKAGGQPRGAGQRGNRSGR